MNIYRHQFVCACPNNKQPIICQLEIRSPKMIYVEKIIAAVAIYAQEFQEPLTDDLARQFPGTQVMLKAHHHGVDIETHRCVEA